MALAPLRPGPQTVRADRLAFATPVRVREAGGAGHWVTIGGSDDAEGEGHGGVHIFISGAGAIEKGPRSLVGQHVAAIAHHSAAGKLKHHPAGHEPPGARDHPHYTEREAPSKAEGEPAKRPGKPYARLHGAEQGTRQEQIGKALGEAQEAAKGAKATSGAAASVAPEHHAAMEAAHNASHRADMAHIAAGGTWTGGGEPRGGTRATRDAVRAQGAAWQEAYGRSSQAEHSESVRHQQAHFGAGGSFSRAGEPRGGTQQTRQALRQHRAAWTPPAHAPQAGTADKDKVADTAVAHQQAQAELAAHRAKNDRNPNPWAPHLSPPVGDAKDRELAEKATRAQLAHQAAQAQQQGAQQQQQQEGQRAHEKEMVRLKAETAQPKPAFAAPQPKAQEKAQSAPQPEQAARAPEPSPEHRDALREGRKLLGQKALDPATHKAKVEAAVHRATSSDPFEGAQRGYARHGDEDALRLAHLEAAGHYQNHANVLQRQHLALTNQDTGGPLAKAQRQIETLTHHEQRAQGQTHPESERQARDLLARSQAISRHYTSGVQHLNAKVQEHRDAHKRLTGAYSWVARESATPAPCFSPPVAR